MTLTQPPHPGIFDEPPVAPDTLSHLGPLRGLAGRWQAAKGVDTSPKADGPETKPYVEHASFEVIDGQTNGPQLFYGLRYHMHINTPDEKITFHDQIGYWLWEPATGLLLQSVTIPRGQALLAQGHAGADDRSFTVEAVRGATTNGIASNPFLDQNFRTDRYRCAITLHDDDSWSYRLDTTLMVEGTAFDHHDTNRLCRVGPPQPNPLDAG